MGSNSINVLDKGFVDLQDVFGNETTIVNAARVSYGKQKNDFDESDAKLLGYLIREKHWSPFRHVFFRFHIKAPEIVLRQWYKHVVGAEWSAQASQLHGWNEISGRYIEMNEFYIPTEWRQQSKSSKQGSEGVFETSVSSGFSNQYTTIIDETMKFYHYLCDVGVAKEQARLILPLSIYTEVIWTASFQCVMNFLDLRLDTHSQLEIREYAKAIEEHLKTSLPTLYEIWLREKQK